MKTLRPFTVVPAELYVERAADRQLELIIDNMGRPGYVLVARQMGKTNLLLNAKRRRDNSREVFTYLDVSNPFPDARSFFRNIIDLTLETACSIPNFVREEIFARRLQPLRLAHIEHEWELRQILRSGIAKLIICLDEIDALTRSEYSDHVFSFIRSIYFSGRSNFAELGNLTYLLSGVAEPADIIKNKDISPFNIGEKIYLDDFSLEETEIFLSKAGIQLTSEAQTRLFHWVRGYPRMTWDVCSILEDLQSKGIKTDQDIIDDVVKGLYFADVEHPPIDHIKRLVEESLEIRDALIAVHYGKSERINDNARTKLYLTGISRFSSQGDTIDFKNAVLEQTLSESYILSLAGRSGRPFISSVIEKIKSGQFHQGLEELALLEESASPAEISLVDLWRGRALFELEKYQEAVKSFEKAIKATDAEVQQSALLYMGVSNYRDRNYKKAAEALSSWEAFPLEYRQYAAIWYAQCLIEESTNLAAAEKILLEIISDPSKLLNSKPFLRLPAEALAHCYIARAEIYRRRRDNDKAKRDLEEAVSFSTADLKLKIYHIQAETSNDATRLMWLRKADQTIRDAVDFRTQSDGQNNSISTFQLGEFLARDQRWGTGSGSKENLDRIFKVNSTGLSVDNLVKELVEHCLFRDASDASFGLVERSIGSEITEGLFGVDARQLMGLLIRSYHQKASAYWTSYVRSFGEDKSPYLSEIAALNAVALNGKFTIGAVNVNSVLDILNREPADFSPMTARQASSLGMLRRYLPLYLALMKSPSAGEIASAQKLLSDLSSFSVFDLPAFGQDHARLMQEGLIAAMKKNGIKPELHPGLKFGRNEYVRVDYDGEQRVGKYKKFEADLLAAKCKIIGKAARESR